MKYLTIAICLVLAGSAFGQTPQTAQAERALAQSQARAHAEMAKSQAELAKGIAAQQAELAPLRGLGQSLSSRAPTDDEALAIAALEGLMAAPPARALPLLKRVLAGQKSDLVKARALFVLSQNDAPEAQTILLDVAKSGSLPLRGEAVRMIGIGGKPAALAALKSMYASEPALREEILSAYLISDRKDALLDLAQNAKDEDFAAIVRTLGAMGAVDELRQLGDAGKHSEELVQAYAISGDLKSLENLARTAKDRAIQLEAIQSIGIVDKPEAAVALSALYRSSGDAEIKEAALQGLMIAGEEKALMALYTNAQNPVEKKAILRTLTLLGGDAAIDAIDAALQGNVP